MTHHDHLRHRKARHMRRGARRRHMARRLVQAARAGEQLSPAEIELLREHQRDLEQRAADIAGLLDTASQPVPAGPTDTPSQE